MSTSATCHFFIILFTLFESHNAFLQEGKFSYNSHIRPILPFSRGLYNGTSVYINVDCESKTNNSKVDIVFIAQPRPCFSEIEADLIAQDMLAKDLYGEKDVFNFTKTDQCQHILLHNIYTTPHDGFYLMGIKVVSDGNSTVHIEIRNKNNGYLSALDWPLLPFYGAMCLFYVILGIMWLVFSFLQWRDMLRIQFWIGGVILMGMLEKAIFYAEYQSINSTGKQVENAMLFAEWVSCAKRTLARMLVVIVSLGFGIVKPRLGSTLHRIVGVGLLYFFLAASDAYMRVTHLKSDQSNKLLVVAIPLAVLDAAICWWIFSALVNTTRTLRLRRNEVKLSLYRHFTNTLIFSVFASIIFMLYSIKNHKLQPCIVVWKDIWLDDAYWHILFSAMLFVIMILLRPTNNNQRYAFVPLLDTEDDEEEPQLVNDAYGVKVRVHHNKPTPKLQSVEDDLLWLQEHIKSDPTLPILDSDEELNNIKFEVSKMQ